MDGGFAHSMASAQNNPPEYAVSFIPALKWVPLPTHPWTMSPGVQPQGGVLTPPTDPFLKHQQVLSQDLKSREHHEVDENSGCPAHLTWVPTPAPNTTRWP